MQTCRDIMTPIPACCRLSTTVNRAARLMEASSVGALPIIDGSEGVLVGILTDRDIVRRVVAAGLDPKTTTVNDVMTPEPVCCVESDPAARAAEVMAQNQLRRVPVVGRQRELVGIIAQADIARKVDDRGLVAEMVESISQPAPETPSTPSTGQQDPDSAGHPMQTDR